MVPQCVLFRLDGTANSARWLVDYDESEPSAGSSAGSDFTMSVDQRIITADEKYLQIGLPKTANFNDSGLYLDDKLNVGYAGHCDVFHGGRAYGGGEEEENAVGETTKFSVGVVELYGLSHYR